LPAAADAPLQQVKKSRLGNCTMLQRHPNCLNLPANQYEACEAACACADAASDFFALARGLGNPLDIEAEWGERLAERLCLTLQRASGVIPKVAAELAATSVWQVRSFAGISDSSFHVVSVEICFRALNNARLSAGYRPIFPAVCWPSSDRSFLALHAYVPDALTTVLAERFEKIRGEWGSVRSDLNESFPAFQATSLKGLIKKEAAQCAWLTSNGRAPRAEETDPTDFRAACKFIDGVQYKNAKQIKSILRDHPEIRTRHPRPNRLEIYVPDWKRMERKRDLAAFDALDCGPEEVEIFLSGTRARQAEIHKSKTGQ
jgi:hypothetical protein